MMAITRSQKRDPTGTGSDTDMEEVSSAVALTQPLDPRHGDLPDNLELLPVPHQQHLELTHQVPTYPITEFRAIIDAIPSVVNIDRVDYRVL
jgi:hypothetical protein